MWQNQPHKPHKTQNSRRKESPTQQVVDWLSTDPISLLSLHDPRLLFFAAVVLLLLREKEGKKA